MSTGNDNFPKRDAPYITLATLDAASECHGYSLPGSASAPEKLSGARDLLTRVLDQLPCSQSVLSRGASSELHEEIEEWLAVLEQPQAVASEHRGVLEELVRTAAEVHRISERSTVPWDELAAALAAARNALAQPAATSGESWRCFHCDEVFTSRQDGWHHFGRDESATPACKIKAAGEYALLEALRNAEDQLSRYHAEDSDTARAMHAVAADNQVALRREEEKGYARGLKDASAAERDSMRTHLEQMREASRAFFAVPAGERTADTFEALEQLLYRIDAVLEGAKAAS
jgi:hypothetical protein